MSLDGLSGLSGMLSGIDLGQNFDVTSALQSKYSDFMQVFSDMSSSMLNDTAMTFPDFPNNPVKPEDASFSLFANYSMNNFEEQLQTLIDAEKFKSTADKQMIQAEG